MLIYIVSLSSKHNRWIMVQLSCLLLVFYDYKIWSPSGMLETSLELDLSFPFRSDNSSVTSDKLFVP